MAKTLQQASVFHAKLPSEGYTWSRISTKASIKFFLTKKNRHERAYKVVDIFGEYPGLYLEFLKLEPTQEHILNFANTYGSLGIPEKIKVGKSHYDGETLEHWAEEISELFFIFGLYRIGKSNLARDKKIIENAIYAPVSKEELANFSEPTAAIVFSYEGQKSVVASWVNPRKPLNEHEKNMIQKRHRETFEKMMAKYGVLEAEARDKGLDEADIDTSSLEDLCKSLSVYGAMLSGTPEDCDIPGNIFFEKCLGNHAFCFAEFIRKTISEKLDGQINVLPVWTNNDHPWTIRLVPKTLLAALWLQFFYAIVRGGDIKECPSCSAVLIIDHTNKGARETKTYCGDQCRIKYHNARRKKASQKI